MGSRGRSHGRAGGRGRRAAAVAALWLAVAGGAGPAAAETPELPRLGPARNFALTAPRNDRVWLTQLRGRVVVLTFWCASCGACPGHLPALLELSRRQAGAWTGRVVFVAVTLDPERDTPAVLRRLGRELGTDPGTWLLLTGTPAEIDVVASWFGVEPRPAGSPTRRACPTTLIDAAGTVRARWPAGDPEALRLAVAVVLGS